MPPDRRSDTLAGAQCGVQFGLAAMAGPERSAVERSVDESGEWSVGLPGQKFEPKSLAMAYETRGTVVMRLYLGKRRIGIGGKLSLRLSREAHAALDSMICYQVAEQALTVTNYHEQLVNGLNRRIG